MKRFYERIRRFYERFFPPREWQPHEEFVDDFLEEHNFIRHLPLEYEHEEGGMIPETDHDEQRYHIPYKPVLSGERMDKGSPDGLLVVTDGLQEEDMRRMKNEH